MEVRITIYCFLALFLVFGVERSCQKSFVIDYANDQFLLDGKPFRYISGSLHYFRMPQEYWEDRMLKMKAAGLNAVQTYVEWRSHEPEPGEYDFNGRNDLVKFLETAMDVGLLVVLRPGPYIDAERDMGGLPYWLLRVNKDMKLRSRDPSFMSYVSKWFSNLMPVMRKYLYENGGPIISVQVENEYGSYDACDYAYTAMMRDMTRKYLGNTVVLFTTDGPQDHSLACGKIDGVYTGIDFGTGVNVTQVFQTQRLHQERGPLLNSEFYPGWLDHWGDPHAQVDTKNIIRDLDTILSMNASVNIYMFHGGTSFGFDSGSNLDPQFQACPTSYDYDAPLTEAGDPTEKYFAIRNLISKYQPVPNVTLPTPSPKMSIPPFKLTSMGSILDLYHAHFRYVNSEYPLTFEELGQSAGYVLYTTKIDFITSDPVQLSIGEVRDRAYVFTDKTFRGILSREQGINTMPLQIAAGQNLTILVENQGRVCFGSGLNDFKGLLGNITLGTKHLSQWTNYLFDLPNMENVLVHFMRETVIKDTTSTLPALYMGTFDLPDQYAVPLDTFLELNGWEKGFAILNGHNLGRYWPREGPQRTLYAPAPYFQKKANWFAVMEQEHAPCGACTVQFVDTHVINGTVPAR